MKMLARIASALLAAFTAMCTVMALHDWIVGDGKTEPGVLMGLTVFFGALTALSSWAAFKGFRPSAVDDTEPRILMLAAKNEGRVTVAEVAVALGVPLERAEAALDSLAQRGRADVQVSESGQTVYAVKGFLSASEKASARDPIT